MSSTQELQKHATDSYNPDKAPLAEFLQALTSRLSLATKNKTYPIYLDDIINLHQPWDPDSLLIQNIVHASEVLYSEDAEWDCHDDANMAAETVGMAVALTRAVVSCVERTVGQYLGTNGRRGMMVQQKLRKRVAEHEDDGVRAKRSTSNSNSNSRSGMQQ